MKHSGRETAAREIGGAQHRDARYRERLDGNVQGDGDAGRRRPVTYEDVVRTAEEIEALGENVTVARVRQRIGGGNQTLSPFVRKWKEMRRAKSRMGGEHQKLLSTATLDALARDIEDHVGASRAEAQEELGDLQDANQELEDVNRSLQSAILTQEEQIEELRDKLRMAGLAQNARDQAAEVAQSKAQGQLEALTTQNKELQAELSQLREGATEARIKGAAQASQIASLEKAAQRLQEAVDTGKTRVAEAEKKAAVAQQHAQGKDALLQMADDRLKETQRRGRELTDQLELARSDAWSAKSAKEDVQRELDNILRAQKKAASTAAVGFGQRQGADLEPKPQAADRRAPSPASAPARSSQPTSRSSTSYATAPASASEEFAGALQGPSPSPSPSTTTARLTPYERERQIERLTASSETMRRLGKPATHEEREWKKDLLVKAAGLRDIHLQRADDMAPSGAASRRQQTARSQFSEGNEADVSDGNSR